MHLWTIYLSYWSTQQDVKKAVLDDMTAVGKEAGLKSFEQVKDLHLHPETFSIANGLLTPTLKSRRADIRRVFQEQISSMYSKTTIWKDSTQ